MFCLECGKELSDRSIICPYCGENLSSLQNTNGDDTTEPQTLAFHRKIPVRIIVVIIVAIVAGLCLLIAVISEGNKPSVPITPFDSTATDEPSLFDNDSFYESEDLWQNAKRETSGGDTAAFSAAVNELPGTAVFEGLYINGGGWMLILSDNPGTTTYELLYVYKGMVARTIKTGVTSFSDEVDEIRNFSSNYGLTHGLIDNFGSMWNYGGLGKKYQLAERTVESDLNVTEDERIKLLELLIIKRDGGSDASLKDIIAESLKEIH